MNRRGSILIDMLMSGMVSIVIGLGVIAMFTTDVNSWLELNGQNVANATSRQPMDILSDHLRNAQPYGGTTSQVLYAAAANSVSPYTDTAGDYTQFWLNTSATPPALEQTTGTTTVVLVNGVSSLTFTYYVSGGNYTPAGTSWVTTANPNAPTSAELPNIAAIGINTVTTVNGYSRTVQTLVRLRNSPTNAPSYG